MSDIEIIRKAAALMRERAEAPFVTAGPWGVASADGMGAAIHHGEHDTVALYASRADGAHIASWHPDVALAVADWLDAIARAVERSGVAHYPEPASIHDAALVTARAYLGIDIKESKEER